METDSVVVYVEPVPVHDACVRLAPELTHGDAWQKSTVRDVPYSTRRSYGYYPVWLRSINRVLTGQQTEQAK